MAEIQNRLVATRPPGKGREAQHTVWHQAEGQRSPNNLRSADYDPRAVVRFAATSTFIAVVTLVASVRAGHGG